MRSIRSTAFSLRMQSHRPSSRAILQPVLQTIIVVLAIGRPPPSLAGQTLKQIAETFAGSAVDQGTVVGAGVGIVMGDAPPQYFSYGLADQTLGRPFTPGGIFEIGSVTKIFTTNILGQAVYRGELKLSDPLSNFAQLGTLPSLTSQVTLEELGDFTAGLPDLGPSCGSPPTPGCLPSERPSIEQYAAGDFLAFFQNTVPADYNVVPPQPITALPASYFYSDFSLGLLGLLLGSRPDAPFDNDTLSRWLAVTKAQLLTPLGMRNTYLEVPSRVTGRLVSGYDLATAQAAVAEGRVVSIAVTSKGGSYSAAPEVKIIGGGGTGASGATTLDKAGGLETIAVQNGGDGYTAPATVTFSGSGSQAARAFAVIVDGRVVGISVADGGNSYTSVPQVTISGGRLANGRDATATAHIANGAVSFVTVEDGGDNYVPPLSVIIAPGDPLHSSIPIWAPAGALSSTIRDMTRLAAAALGHARVEGYSVPTSITEGFRIAETPYACHGGSPKLASCTSTVLSGLAWSIMAADEANGLPATVLKDGGLPGFSTEIMLMPERDIAVVVFTNTREGTSDAGDDPTIPSSVIARSILRAIAYDGVKPE